MKRRDFLRTSGCFMATASLGGITSSCGDDDPGPESGVYGFPQGVASGDPRETSIVLWTRAVLVDGAAGAVTVTAQVSTTEDFAALVVEEELTVDETSDNTLRLLVTGLDKGTSYYYRFVAGADVSTVGRTLTAPDRDADERVNLIWVNCQDREAGFYDAYQHMLAADEAAAAEDKAQFVVHMGDFIYESIAAGFSGAQDENLLPIELLDADGNPRAVEDFPSGGGDKEGGGFYADTLADYRHLYKQYLKDPALRAARARWPFICIWDDHEFTNDCWQSQANYHNDKTLGEASQNRKLFANQAWFEYIPANLSDAEGVPGVEPEAKDFEAVTVEDTAFSEFDDNLFATEANNVAAVGSITIYRSFRFGRHVELVMTDERSYRSDHAIAEDRSHNNAFFFDPRQAVPLEAVWGLDAGRTANGGNPPATFIGSLPNDRIDSPPGTMLGASQKAWFKATMQGSDATWKIWGNEVPLMHVLYDTGSGGVTPFDMVFNSDTWDGYNTERKELMAFLLDNNIRNVVSISGDLHAHFSSYVMDSYEVAEPTRAVVEFVAAGISSNTMFSFLEGPTRQYAPGPLRKIITYDETEFGGTNKFVNNLNTSILYGSRSSLAMADTNDRAQMLAARDETVNPHMIFVDTHAQGYGRMIITADQVQATLVTVDRPLSDKAAAPTEKATATFTVPLTEAGGTPEVQGPVLTGIKPFPLE